MFSQMKWARLQRVLPAGHDDLYENIARIAVLYEDLKIELAGMKEESLEPMDKAGSDLRLRYFLRRSICTLRELAEAFSLLDKSRGFQTIKASFNEGARRDWESTVQFFRENNTLLKGISPEVIAREHDQLCLYSY